MRKEKFCPTCNEEAETHIWVNFCLGQVIVETNKKATYKRLLKKLGEPNKKQLVHHFELIKYHNYALNRVT